MNQEDELTFIITKNIEEHVHYVNLSPELISAARDSARAIIANGYSK